MKIVMKNNTSQNRAFTNSSMTKLPKARFASIAFKFVLLTLLSLGIFTSNSQAAVIAGWNVSGLPGGNGLFGASPLAATTTDPNVVVGGLTRGAGVSTTGTAAARAWGGVDWQSADANAAATANKYATVTVQANSGYTLSLSSISTFSYRRSGSGPTTGTVQYQIGAGSFTDITTVSYTVTTSGGATLPAINLSGIAALQNIPAGTVVTFRIVNYGGTGATGTWYIFDVANSAANDFEIQGTADVPGAPPQVTDITPASITVGAEGTASFTVTSTGGVPDNYYWYKLTTVATNLISSATTATLTLTNVHAVDAADYRVVLSNSFGMSTSAVVTLTVNDPYLVWGPVSQLNLEGSISGFSVNAKGTSLQYQWYRGTPPSGTLLSDGGRIAGAQTRFLTISNTAASDADTYYAIVSNGSGSITTDPATLTTTSGSGTLVTWDFNALGLAPASAEPSQGQATARATTTGTTNSFQPAGGSANDPYNSILGVTNYYYGSSTYPNNGTSNKLVGAQFSVSTLGFKNLTVTYDQRASSTGSRYTRLQFTTNGTDYIDYPVGSAFTITPSGASTWEPRSFSLAGFPGVANNPNFGLRVVSEFESTATLGAVNNANYVGLPGTTGSYGTSGTLSYDMVKVNAEPIVGGNTLPTITAIAAQSTPNNAAKVVAFTVGDVETAAGSLTVTATSYNQTLVSDGNIVPGGSGASRNITITPNGVDGVVPILVTVTDGSGDSTATWFNLTLTPLNSAPHITQIPYTNTLANTPISIPFVIGDDSPVGGLTLASNTLNPGLISFANIAITGSGSNRVLTLTPTANTLGAAPVSISVSDGVNTATTTFTLMVRPSVNVVFNDYFEYANGDLTNVTSYFWSDHSGATAMTVAGGAAIIDGNKAQDCNALLIGTPYTTNSGVTLYSSFKVNFSVLPNGAGAYFAHFKDNSTFGFFGRVWAATNGASEGGKFRLGIGNSSSASATSGQFPRDLDLNTTYTVVTRVVLSNGFSSIWINPTSETDTHVTDTTTTTNSAGMYAYALRQSTGEGTLALDNLVVAKSFAAVVPVLSINKTGANPVVTWDNPTLPLQAAPVVTGNYTNIPGASSPYTDTSGDPQRYFRLYKP